jgi:hypothetical protein
VGAWVLVDEINDECFTASMPSLFQEFDRGYREQLTDVLLRVKLAKQLNMVELAKEPDSLTFFFAKGQKQLNKSRK